MSDIEKIFETVKSELLTVEVKEKISVLVEAKINEKVNDKVEELEGLFEDYKEKELNKLEEKAVEYVDEFLVDKMDEYMDYVSEEYMKENSLEIESGVKSLQYDKLVESMKKTFAENQLVESELQISDDLLDSNEELKTQVNKQIKENMELKKAIKGANAVRVFNEKTEGLSITEKEKIKSLSSDFDIDDVEEFGSKISTLVESIASFTEEEKKAPTGKVDELVEDVDYSSDLSVIGERKNHEVYDELGDMMKYL